MHFSPTAAFLRNMILSAGAVLLLYFALRGEDLPPPPPGPVVTAPAVFEFHDIDELRSFFLQENYSLAGWDAGDRTVPRLYLTRVPRRWADKVAPHLPIDLKKRYFFFVYSPLVLKANEEIADDRRRLLALRESEARTGEGEVWLRTLAGKYFVDTTAVDTTMMATLLERVDIVPPSLALAQAAIESGWSTSRFAVLGNALFGQWTWRQDGITPARQRGGMGDYRIRAFDNPGQSVAAYMHNLNTHRGYASFRAERARLRDRGHRPTGPELAATLIRYSEKGQEYVDMLRQMIRVNGLETTDEAVLREMRPVLLVPVGEGVN